MTYANAAVSIGTSLLLLRDLSLKLKAHLRRPLALKSRCPAGLIVAIQVFLYRRCFFLEAPLVSP